MRLFRLIGLFFLMCISYTCEECREVHRLGTPCRCETTGSLMHSNTWAALARQ